MMKRSISWLLMIGVAVAIGAWVFTIWTGGCGSTQQEITTTTVNTTTTSTSTSTTLHVIAWGTPERIGTFSNSALHPKVAINDNGDALVVWEVQNSPWEIFANHYQEGVGWGTAVAIEPYSGNTSMLPQVAIDTSGNGIAVWSQYLLTGFSYCMANSYTAGTGWATGGSIESVNGNTSYPQIVMDAGGDAMAVWAKGSVWVNTFTAGSGWGTAISIESSSGAADPHLAQDSAGNAILVWQDDASGSNPSIKAIRFTTSSGWSTPATLMNHTGSVYANPRVATDDSGRATAVWDAYSGGTVRIWASRFNGTSWGTAAILDNDPTTNAYNPIVVMDSSGNALVAWDQGANVMSVRYTEAGGWGTVETIRMGDSVTLAIDGDGNAIAAWRLASTIWAKRYQAGSGWGAAATISAVDADADYPHISMNNSGEAIVVWQQLDSIWVNQYK